MSGPDFLIPGSVLKIPKDYTENFRSAPDRCERMLKNPLKKNDIHHPFQATGV